MLFFGPFFANQIHNMGNSFFLNFFVFLTFFDSWRNLSFNDGCKSPPNILSYPSIPFLVNTLIFLNFFFVFSTFFGRNFHFSQLFSFSQLFFASWEKISRRDGSKFAMKYIILPSFTFPGKYFHFSQLFFRKLRKSF